MHGRKDWYAVSHFQTNEQQNHPIARQTNHIIRIVVIGDDENQEGENWG